MSAKFKRATITLGLGCIVTFGAGFLTPPSLHARGGCGDDSECYSVPDGCFFHQGCEMTLCYLEDCPSSRQTFTTCHYCEVET